MNQGNLVLQRENKIESKKISDTEYRISGLSKNIRIVDKIEDLRKSPPNIIIAEAIRNAKYIVNKTSLQEFKKGQKYILSSSIYEQLHYDKISNRKLLKPSTSKFMNIYKPYRGQDLNNKTLLIWRTGGIGDLCFIQPNLKYLKEKYPTSKIIFACGAQYKSMVETWKNIDELIELPFNLQRLVHSDYHAIFEGVIERCKEAETTNAYELFTKWLGLNVPKEKLYPEQEPSEEDLNIVKSLLKTLNPQDKPFVLFQLRASSPLRSPRLSKWKEIIDKVNEKGYLVIITDSPPMESSVQKFIDTLNFKDLVINFSGLSKKLSYSIALTKLAKFVVSPDSSLIHIAESVKTKGLGIYGAFPGHIRLSTYKYIEWIDGKSICSPCFSHGHKPCLNSRSGAGICYDNIDSNEVLKIIEKNMS